MAADAGLGDTGQACGTPCGGECCAAGQSCVDGQCHCEPESDPALCARLGKICGSLAAEDNCGTQRSVASCGACPQRTACTANGTVCACEQESGEAFCRRLGKTCGLVSAKDSCGLERTATCGSCAAGSICDATNTCACVPMGDVEFCQAHDIECGGASGRDNCNDERRVAECGPCGQAEICDPQRKCQLCDPETKEVFCARQGKDCGEVAAVDNCGVPRTVTSCGSCASGKICDANNVCSTPDAPDNDTCSSAQILAFGPSTRSLSVTGDTSYASNDFASPGCPGNTGNDVVFVFDTTGLGIQDFTATVAYTAANNYIYPLLYLRRSCESNAAANEVACVRKSSGGPLGLVKPHLPEGVYYLVVDSGSAADKGPFELEVNLSDSSLAPDNDLCAGAEPLSFDSTGTRATVSGATTATSNHNYAGTCAVAGAAHSGPDVVYTFALSAPASISARVTRSQTMPTFRPAVYLRHGDCESAAPGTEVACANEASGISTATQLNAPVGRYFVIVDGINGTFGDFDLEVTLGAAVDIPDNCFAAQQLGLMNGSVTVTGDTTLATNDGDGKCRASSGKDLVYVFTTRQTANVNIKVTPAAGSTLQPTVYVRSACWDRATEVGCSRASSAGASGTLVLDRLPANTWYLWVDGDSSTNSGAFTLTVTATPLSSPANDNCSLPQPIVLTGGTASRTGTTVEAANDYAGSCNATMPGGDVVYEVTVPGTDHVALTAKVTRDPASTAFQPAVYIRRDCADSRSQYACGKYTTTVTTATATAWDLAPGTYYVIVDSLTVADGRFTLDLTTGPARQLPDSCASAQTLILDAAGTASVSNDTTDAAADSNGLNCKGVSNGNDLVYRLDTTGRGTKTLMATLTFTAPGNKISPLLYLRTVCDTEDKAEEVGCAYSGTSGPLTLTRSNLPEGVYYLWVDTDYSGDKGPFRLDVALVDAVDNDQCTGKKALPLIGDAAYASGSTFGAASDYAGTGSCSTLTGPDVVYSFEVGGVLPRSVSVQVRSLTSGYQPGVYVRGVCDLAGAADQQGCGVDAQGTALAEIPGLRPGTWYLVVDSLTSTGGQFELELTLGDPYALPATCADARPVRFDPFGYARLAGDTTNSGNDFGILNCLGGTGNDLVYLLDLTGMGTRDLTATATFGGGVQPALSLRKVCLSPQKSDELACVRASAISSSATLERADLAPGRYFLVVDSTAPVAKGSFTLELQLSEPYPAPVNATCGTADELPIDPATGIGRVVATTRGGLNADRGPCAAMDGPEAVYSFTLTQDAKVTARVIRDAGSQDFTPSVYLRSGCASRVVEQACATDVSGVATAIASWLPLGTHYVYVDGTAATSGKFALELETGPAVRGDTCLDPVELAFDPGTGIATRAGDTSLATQSGDGSCGSGSPSGSDLVYKMSLSRPKNVQIDVTPSAGSSLKPMVYVRGTCDRASTELSGACVSKTTVTAASLSFKDLAAGDYFIWVDGSAASANGPFTLTVTATDVPPPPDNSRCTGARDLTFTGGVAVESGDTTWATADAVGTCDSLATARDVFYRLHLTQEASIVAKVVRDPSTSSYLPTLYLRGDCQSGAPQDEIFCAVPSGGTATAVVSRLLPGSYYLVVDGQTTTSGKFSLEVTQGAPVRGDSCADAVALPAFDPITGVAEIRSDNTLATNASAGSCSGGSGTDLVYRFSLAGPKKVDIALTPAAGSALRPTVYLRSTCNETLTELGCKAVTSGAASLSFPTLSAGTYYVWVDGGSSAKGPFTLAVTAADPVQSPPSNDACGTAEPLTFSLTSPARSLPPLARDTTHAVNDSSGTCAVSNGPDVAYSFTTSAAHKLTAKVVRDASTFEPVVYLRAACDVELASNEVTCAKHTSGTATAVVNNLPAGTWYLVVDGMKGTYGAFTLDVTLDAPVLTGPANESCFNAQALALSGGNAQVQGSTAGGISEAAALGCASNASGLGPDAVYSFEVPLAGQRLNAQIKPALTYAPALYLRRSCGSVLPADELACAYSSTAGKPVTLVVRDLKPGSYYLWVDAGTTGTNASGSYTLDVNVDFPRVPTNDTCARPEPLVPGVPVSGDTTDASSTFGPNLPAGACGSQQVKGNDVVYSYAPAADGNFTITVTSAFDAVLWYAERTCEASACAAYKDSATAGGTESLTVPGVAGRIYFFFVDGYAVSDFGAYTIQVQ